MQPKCPIFRQKCQKFPGEGAQPPLGREIPLTRPLALGAAALYPIQIFPNFYHYAGLQCCYWRIWEIESSASFVSRPIGLLNGTLLEVGPVNMQSSHWIKLLMQFVTDWCALANSIINIKHSFRITYDIYTPKHTFLWPFCEILRANVHENHQWRTGPTGPWPVGPRCQPPLGPPLSLVIE